MLPSPAFEPGDASGEFVAVGLAGEVASEPDDAVAEGVGSFESEDVQPESIAAVRAAKKPSERKRWIRDIMERVTPGAGRWSKAWPTAPQCWEVMGAG